MLVQDVLARKNSGREALVTITPAATITEFLELMLHHGIGAVVVSSDGRTLDGIISERDVVRHLAVDPTTTLSQPVSALMTAEVNSCSLTDDVRQIASVMTAGKFRHLPVIDDGALVGIVSIGDIVKSRIDQLEAETEHLVDYLYNG